MILGGPRSVLKNWLCLRRKSGALSRKGPLTRPVGATLSPNWGRGAGGEEETGSAALKPRPSEPPQGIFQRPARINLKLALLACGAVLALLTSLPPGLALESDSSAALELQYHLRLPR